MQEDTFNICRLCLIVQETNKCFVLEDNSNKKFMLENFLPELDLRLTKSPIVCEICLKLLETSYNFKHNCQKLKETLNTLINGRGSVNSEKNKLITYSNKNVSNICQICLIIGNKPENELINFSYFPKNMCRSCIPEINLEFFDNQLLCLNCAKNLEIVYTFKLNCLNIEKILQSHYSINSNIFELLSKEIQQPVVKNEIVEIKTEPIFEDHQSTTTDTDNSNNGKSLDDNEMTNENDTKLFKCDYCQYKSNIKSCLLRHEIVHRSFDESELFKCTQCQFKTKRKDGLKRHEITKHNKVLEELFKCSSCTYSTKHRSYLRVHEVIHENITITNKSHQGLKINKIDKPATAIPDDQFSRNNLTNSAKCPHCPYEAKFKCFLKRHMLVHESKSNKMFKCDLCKYESKRKDSLIKHGLVHKGLDEAKYQCAKCSYRGKSKNYLTRHMVMHTTNIEMFKCTKCNYESKRRHNLKEHMLIHERL